MSKQDWICTDPDTDQWAKLMSDKVFLFRQGSTLPVEIDLNDYDENKIESIINSYGYTNSNKVEFANIVQEFGDDHQLIIAECIFETLHYPSYDEHS